MREIDEKEYVNNIEDYVANAICDMLTALMTRFEKMGYLRELDPMSENAIVEDTWTAAEELKENVIERLEGLGLDVRGDGRDF